MPEYKEWFYETLDQVKRTRTIFNVFGRIRIFLGKIDEIERQALNFPVQSAAADIMSFGLIALHKKLSELKKRNPTIKARIVLSVHDSVVLLVPRREQLLVAKMLQQTMCIPRKVGNYQVSFKGELSIMDDLRGEKGDEKQLEVWIKDLEDIKYGRQKSHE